MEKGKRVETVDGEIPLPEAMIQHIQSFLSEVLAARTTVISKAWYKAWLSRPVLNITSNFDFTNSSRDATDVFEEFSNKTTQRYRQLGLKIEKLRLRIRMYYESRDLTIARNLIVAAMKLGTSDVELELPNSTLPHEVLGSQTLLSLSAHHCKVDGNYVSCSRLKSLTLENVAVTSDEVFKNIVSCCISLEELSLSECTGVVFSQVNMYELHKLRRLFLHDLDVDRMFFTDFGSRFPCLKDLSIHFCYGSNKIQIAGTSLETVSFKMFRESWKCRARFDVPNIRKFTYLGSGLPPLTIDGGSREWELDISIHCDRFHKMPWFLNLKKLLQKFRLSRISLTLELQCLERGRSEHVVDVEVLPNPFVVENLTIDAPPTFCSALMVRLFGIIRPKFRTHYCEFITRYWQLVAKQVAKQDFPWSDENPLKESVYFVYKSLMKQVISPNCGIPDQDMFGQFGLKKANMKVYEVSDFSDTVWLPYLLNEPLDLTEITIKKRKIQFELIWA